ncbi:membrane protein [Rhodopirellula sp. SWK7]|nr:membrane protein [Rhodopirellula sp. SWK7]
MTTSDPYAPPTEPSVSTEPNGSIESSETVGDRRSILQSTGWIASTVLAAFLLLVALGSIAVAVITFLGMDPASGVYPLRLIYMPLLLIGSAASMTRTAAMFRRSRPNVAIRWFIASAVFLFLLPRLVELFFVSIL